MLALNHWLFVACLVVTDTAFGWTRVLDVNNPIHEDIEVVGGTGLKLDVLLRSGTYGSNLVDLVIANANGNILLYQDLQCYGGNCGVFYEPFDIGGCLGHLLLLNLPFGGNMTPYESFFVFIPLTAETAYQSDTPDDWHSYGGPAPYYLSMLDLNGDGYAEYLLGPRSFLSLADVDCASQSRQSTLVEFNLLTISSDSSLSTTDGTLEALTADSDVARSMWIEDLTTWLDESADISFSSGPGQEVRELIWRMKEALAAHNFELIAELYEDL